jgi:hypothetical protein
VEGVDVIWVGRRDEVTERKKLNVWFAVQLSKVRFCSEFGCWGLDLRNSRSRYLSELWEVECVYMIWTVKAEDEGVEDSCRRGRYECVS